MGILNTSGGSYQKCQAIYKRIPAPRLHLPRLWASWIYRPSSHLVRCTENNPTCPENRCGACCGMWYEENESPKLKPGSDQGSVWRGKVDRIYSAVGR